MDTVFIVENDHIGSWYIGKIKMKLGPDYLPVYRSYTHEKLNEMLCKKYTGYDTPYINLVFLNEYQCTCHGILKWLSNMERKFKRDPEKYRDIETLIKALKLAIAFPYFNLIVPLYLLYIYLYISNIVSFQNSMLIVLDF